MNTNFLKTQISQLLPTNFTRLISALRHRQANNLIIDFFWGIVGDKDQLDTTDKTDLVSAINEILHGAGGFNPVWLDMQHAYTVINFPAMNKGEVKIIRIQEQGSNLEVEDGWATIGGMNGVKIGNRAMLVCMQNSAGGTLADVGYKYAIVGNQIPAPQIITVADYASLPDEVDAILGVIYLTIDTGNIYYFDATAGDYMQIGSVIEGELIDEFNFIDTNNNPIVPDGTHLYKDIINTPEKYYKWNGLKFELFENQGGQQVMFYNLFNGIPGAPPYTAGNYGILYVNQASGEIYTWDGSQFVGSGATGLEWENPTNKALGYYNALLNKIDNSNLLNKSSGVVNSGVYIAKTKKGNISGDVQLEGAENFIYTMTGNVNFKFDNLTLADDESAVFTIQLTGNFAFSFPIGVVAQPYNDTYDGSKTNYLTVVITETVSGAVKGYYNLITA